MKIVFFCESIISDFNNDSVYFLRGIINEFVHKGHQVTVYEKEGNSALSSIIKDFGKTGINEFKRYYPQIDVVLFKQFEDIKANLKDTQVVFADNSTDTETISFISESKHSSSYKFIFFDSSFAFQFDNSKDLSASDAVLVTDLKLLEKYKASGFTKVFLWQEAVDVKLFHPRKSETEGQVVLISNWTEEDRTAEIEEFLIKPVSYLRVKAKVYGSKYPKNVKKMLGDAGIECIGWTPSFKASEIYSRFSTTMVLPGSSTCKESKLRAETLLPLASGIPLISAGWNDTDKLFNKGRDYLFAKDGYEMKHYILEMMNSTLKEVIIGHGLKAVSSKNTCVHRLNELDKIFESIGIEKIKANVHSSYMIHN